MRRLKTLDFARVLQEVVSPSRFLRIMGTRPESIRQVRIIPARLGQPGFGSILVEFTAPTYIPKRNRG